MKQLILVLVSLLALSSYALAEDVVVIVNPANNSVIDKSDVKKIFMGKAKSFSDGEQVVPINLEEGAVRDQFNEDYLGKKQSQLNAYWARLEFSGKALPPEEKSAQETIDMVKSNKGAIGYIERSLATDDVKIVQ